MHAQSWEDKGKILEVRSNYSWVSLDSIVWHFLVFRLLCSCLLYPCVNICFFFLFLFLFGVSQI